MLVVALIAVVFAIGVGHVLGGPPFAVAGGVLTAVPALTLGVLLIRQAEENQAGSGQKIQKGGSINLDEADQPAEQHWQQLMPPQGAPAPPSPGQAPPWPGPRQSAPQQLGPGSQPPGYMAAADPPPVQRRRMFPQPNGTEARASRSPWRLPNEPGPAGISADEALVGGIQVRAASMVGPGHRCAIPATPRQDAYRLAVDKSGRYLVIAIADGMSDSSHSHLGANVAVNTLVQQLGRSGDPVGVPPQDLFVQAAGQMVATARQRGLTDDAVRAAVLTAIIEIDPTPDGHRMVRLASLADVSGWVRRGRSWAQIAGDRKEGLDGSRLDRFLPFHPREVRACEYRLGSADVLALTSDGIGDVLGPGVIGSWFADQWAEPPHISDFIDAIGFEAKGEQDDRTAVVLWCTPGRRS